MTEARIVVAGEINADLVLRGLSSFPALGCEVLADESELVLGSASAVCASGLARLGDPVAFLGKVGDDLLGRFCIEEMKGRGIDVEAVAVARLVATGITVSLSSGGERALVTSLGAIATFSADDVLDEHLESARHLHVSSFFLQESLRPRLHDLFRRARGLGLTTSLDPGHDPGGSWHGGLAEALREVDVFLPNEEELRATSGTDDLPDALRSFGPVQVVAKLGASGAAALDRGSLLSVAAPRIRVVDTTGAGDSFDAGFIHAWLRDEPLETCLRYGVAAGSLSTRALGGTKAQPSLEELEGLLRES